MKKKGEERQGFLSEDPLNLSWQAVQDPLRKIHPLAGMFYIHPYQSPTLVVVKNDTFGDLDAFCTCSLGKLDIEGKRLPPEARALLAL